MLNLFIVKINIVDIEEKYDSNLNEIWFVEHR